MQDFLQLTEIGQIGDNVLCPVKQKWREQNIKGARRFLFLRKYPWNPNKDDGFAQEELKYVFLIMFFDYPDRLLSVAFNLKYLL